MNTLFRFLEKEKGNSVTKLHQWLSLKYTEAFVMAS
jgi:hypothetical protein